MVEPILTVTDSIGWTMFGEIESKLGISRVFLTGALT